MHTRTILLALLALLGTAAQPARAQLLHELFADHAVLQRGQPIAVWGQAAEGELITVSLAGATARAQADRSGSWHALLPAMAAGGPYTLTAQSSAGGTQSANDVLVGDVFLCSGQSNMELDVSRVGDSRNEISIAANDRIRMLTVPHAATPAPLPHFQDPVAWQVASSDTVPGWSAVCFFFARELQPTTHAPIGLLHASWGGSNIRPWISAPTLKAIGGFDASLDLLNTYARDPSAAQAQFAARWESWWREKAADRAGTEPWTAAPKGAHRGDDSAWQSTPPELGDWRDWGIATLQTFTGLIWFRTHVTLTAAQAAGAATLSLGAINQIDETWLNGKALGNTFGYGTDREYSIPAGWLHAGDNLIVVNVLSTYGGGGLLRGGAARALHLAHGDAIPLDGPWQYRIVPAAVRDPPQAPWQSVVGLTTLYNAMIAPMVPYGLRGAVWYQGESNTGEPETYQGLLAAMMADWRQQFGAGLPFLIVQLPNFGAPPSAPEESSWARVREAQRLAVASDPHAALAVTIDIGEPRNLHPTNKQDVGGRLARAARHLIYGESVTPSGPVPLGATRAGRDIAVEFGDIEGGLIAYSHDSPIGFELCGDSPGSCRFAQARIEGLRILLSSRARPVRRRGCVTAGQTAPCARCSMPQACRPVRSSCPFADLPGRGERPAHRLIAVVV